MSGGKAVSGDTPNRTNQQPLYKKLVELLEYKR